jgi:hypothetical protein
MSGKASKHKIKKQTPGSARKQARKADLRHEKHDSKELSLQDRQVLAIIHDAPVKDFIHFSQRYISIPSEDVRKSVDKLKAEGFVEILEVVDNEDLRYFHTKKVSKELLNGIEPFIKHP